VWIDVELPIYVSIVGHSGLLNAATVASSPVCCCIPTHCGAGEAQIWASWMEYSIRVQSGRLCSKCPVCTEPPWWHGSKEGNCIHALHSHECKCVPVYSLAPWQEAVWRSGGVAGCIFMSALNGCKRSALHLATVPRGTSTNYPLSCRLGGLRAIVDALAKRNVVTLQKIKPWSPSLKAWSLNWLD
jgi:hypothetical protein